MSVADRIVIIWASVVITLAIIAIRDELARYYPPPPPIYPIGQPGATPVAWATPTSRVPTAVPIRTGEPAGWVNCESRILETPVMVCEPRGDGGY